MTMTLFENTVKLRGFLSEDPEHTNLASVTSTSVAVVTLAIPSGKWKVQTNEWISHTEQHRVRCSSAFLFGFARTLKQGDYVEVEGELHISEYDVPVVVEGERLQAKRSAYEVHATQIRKLDYPHIGVEEGDGP
jgi:single-stranded DNA-binding protein